jgi:uncharacterized protein DUF4864
MIHESAALSIVLLATTIALAVPAAGARSPTAGAQRAAPEPAAAGADMPLAPAEWTAIRRAIRGQLDALRARDAPRAFAFASDGIRERFGDAPAFLQMVESSYAALLAARYTEFLEGAVIDGHTIQPLRLVMADDTVLVALYEMQRDAAGRWRIAGCVIAPSTVRST